MMMDDCDHLFPYRAESRWHVSNLWGIFLVTRILGVKLAVAKLAQ